METPGTQTPTGGLQLNCVQGAGYKTGHMVYRKIDDTDKGRQGGTRSLSFVSGQREREKRIREAEGEERGRKDRYENPVDKTERQRGIRTRRHVKEGYRGEGP